MGSVSRVSRPLSRHQHPDQTQDSRLQMRVLFFVLLATCLLVADANGKKHKKNREAKKAKARSGAGRMNGRDSKVLGLLYVIYLYNTLTSSIVSGRKSVASCRV